jgi:integrase
MNIDPTQPNPEYVGGYLSGLATGMRRNNRSLSVATIERRLAALCWRYRMMGTPLDRRDGRIAAVLRGIRNSRLQKPAAKDAILTEDLLALLTTLDLRKLAHVRDKAILLLGFAGGLRRSEIVGLDLGPGQSVNDPHCKGWVEFKEEGVLLHLRNKTEIFRTIEVGRGSADMTCPVASLQTWITLARITKGPVFRRVLRGQTVSSERLRDAHVAVVVKRAVRNSAVGGHLPEGERIQAYSGHSLRAGLASSAEVEEAIIQKQLGHASAEMTRRYQRRRERFRFNLTKASGL